jgi:hypothetical protein
LRIYQIFTPLTVNLPIRSKILLIQSDRLSPGVKDFTLFFIPIEQIEQHFALSTELLTGVPSPFVCNMDEMGHQEWADATEKVCYVPSDLQTTHVNYYGAKLSSSNENWNLRF